MKKSLAWILLLALLFTATAFAEDSFYKGNDTYGSLGYSFTYRAEVNEQFSVSISPSIVLQDDDKYEGYSLYAPVNVQILLDNGYNSTKSVVLYNINSQNGFGSEGKGLCIEEEITVPEGKASNIPYNLLQSIGSESPEIPCDVDGNYLEADKEHKSVDNTFFAVVPTFNLNSLVTDARYYDNMFFLFKLADAVTE